MHLKLYVLLQPYILVNFPHFKHCSIWDLCLTARGTVSPFPLYQMFHVVSYPSHRLQLLVSVSLMSRPAARYADVPKSPPSASLHFHFLYPCLGSQQTLWIPRTEGNPANYSQTNLREAIAYSLTQQNVFFVCLHKI